MLSSTKIVTHVFVHEKCLSFYLLLNLFTAKPKYFVSCTIIYIVVSSAFKLYIICQSYLNYRHISVCISFLF